MRRIIPALLSAIIILAFSEVTADELHFTSGGKIECVVLQETKTDFAVLRNQSVRRYDKKSISDVLRQHPKTVFEPTGSSRIPTFASIVTDLAKQTWAVDLHAIPATVIDAGVLKNVPYKSHRVASDCEVNVYGDPTNPACLEVGVLGKYLENETAKEKCIDFVAKLFQVADQELILRLDHNKDLRKREGLTFEVTPPTAKDAYGGWWISVYNESLLDQVRASKDELAAITTPHVAAKSKITVAKVTSHLDDEYHWMPDDFASSRTPNSTSSGGGRVYVHGYTRKDGTYVRPHTRSK